MVPLLIIAAVAAFALSLGLNRLMVSYGGKLGLMDLPGERRVHVTPIPRAGGLAVWVSFLVVAFGLSYLAGGEFQEFRSSWLVPFTVASAVLVLVGLLDDSGGIKPWWKLLGQMVAAAVFFLLRPESHGNLFGFDAPMWVDAAIFIGWAVLLINAFNLIDGLDGLCGGLALIALVALGLLAALNGHLGATAMMFIMAAAVMGFLRYNWNPARIFLGDTGSMILGFFIAAAATQTTGRRAILGVLLLPIAVAGVPLLDVLLAIWRRSVRNLMNQWTGGDAVGVFKPDKDHLHHRFLAGNGQKKVTRLLHTLALVLTVLAFLPMIFGDRVIGISVIGLMVLSFVGLRNFARIELVQSGSVLHLALKRPGGNRRLRMAAFFYDCLALTCCALFAVWLESDFLRKGFNQLETVQFTVMFVILGAIGIFLSKAYRRVWSRATLRDLAGVVMCVAAAGVLCATFFSLMQKDIQFSTVRVSLMATCLAMLLVPLPRCSVELLRELAVDAGHRRFHKSDGTNQRHVVVYGGGDLGNLFIDYLKTCPPAHFKNFRVVGFVDDNPSLKRRIMRGFPVMGDLDELDGLTLNQPLHGVIVAISHPSSERLARLREIAEERGFNIYSWCFDLTPGVMEIHRPAVAMVGAGARKASGTGALERAQ